MQQAWQLYEAGNEPAARRLWQLQLDEHPRDRQARFNLASALEAIGHDNEAKAHYLLILEQGDDVATLVNLAKLYHRHGDKDQAYQLLKHAARSFPTDAMPVYTYADILAFDGNSAEADKQFKRALKTDWHNGFAHLHYARFLFDRNDHLLALKHAREGVQQQPSNHLGWLLLGDIQTRTKQYKQALVAFERSAAIHDSPEIRNRIINTRKKMGLWKE